VEPLVLFMPVRLLLELLVHHDFMAVVTVVAGVEESKIAVVMVEQVEMEVRPVEAVAEVAWVKVLEQLVVSAVKVREGRYAYG